MKHDIARIELIRQPSGGLWCGSFAPKWINLRAESLSSHGARATIWIPEMRAHERATMFRLGKKTHSFSNENQSFLSPSHENATKANQ